MLQSGQAWPRQHHAYDGSLDIVNLAAIYRAAIVRSHPFVDGNKRTGFLAGILFLELNGYRFIATEEDAAQAVLALAAEQLDETAYAAFLRVNSAPEKKRKQ